MRIRHICHNSGRFVTIVALSACLVWPDIGRAASADSEGLPDNLSHYRLPLPIAYESTGAVTHFTNALEPHARSREVFTFHRPKELIRLVTLDDQVRRLLTQMPPLETGRLWPVQIESIQNLEDSLADNRPRSLIQMATGSGKTYTAVSFCYRLIKFAKAKRIKVIDDPHSNDRARWRARRVLTLARSRLDGRGTEKMHEQQRPR